MFCLCMGKVWEAWGIINTPGSCSTKLRAPKLWDQIWWELQNHQAILRIEHDVKWDIIGHGYVTKHSTCFVAAWARSNQPETQKNTLRSYSSTPHSTQAVGPGLVGTAKQQRSSSGWCMLLHKEPHAMDQLPPIPHILCLHGQGMTITGHN